MIKSQFTNSDYNKDLKNSSILLNIPSAPRC